MEQALQAVEQEPQALQAAEKALQAAEKALQVEGFEQVGLSLGCWTVQE